MGGSMASLGEVVRAGLGLAASGAAAQLRRMLSIFFPRASSSMSLSR